MPNFCIIFVIKIYRNWLSYLLQNCLQAKTAAFLWGLVASVRRVLGIVIIFSPCLGLLDLLWHWHAEQFPFQVVVIFSVSLTYSEGIKELLSSCCPNPSLNISWSHQIPIQVNPKTQRSNRDCDWQKTFMGPGLSTN